MCVKPTWVWWAVGPSHERVAIPCGGCWACLKNKTDDLVGRMLCEYSTSDWGRFYTLTYDDRKASREQTQVINKRDWQNFMKRLRKGGHKARYLTAGEYGTRKGRAHFHTILTGFGNALPVSEYWNGKDALSYWPWGHVDIKNVNENTIRYVAKYLTKSKDAKAKNSAAPHAEWVTYSKKPLLGADFILQKAARQAEMKVFPQTFNYSPPGGADRAYSFYGKAQILFYDYLFALWPEAHSAPKTKWAENAYKRWIRVKQREAWDQLPTKSRDEILGEEFRRVHPEREDPEQTVAARMQRRYAEIDRFIAKQSEEDKWRVVAEGIVKDGLAYQLAQHTIRQQSQR